jgi:aldose 1-epimerase
VNIRHAAVGVTRPNASQGPTQAEAWTLDTGDGLTVTVWTYGATLVEILVPDRRGQLANVVLRLPELRDYEDRVRNPYLGATLGRFGRCVSGARFRLDGTEYLLDRNHGRHQIHGGTIGFDQLTWDAECGREGDDLVLRLALESPDGDQGYPGTVSAQTLYRVSAGGPLVIEYLATTTASTVVGLTNHSYWNLAGTGTVDSHLLAVNAQRVLPADDEHIPVGDPVPVAGTELDFTRPRPLGGQLLDHCFALTDRTWAAELADPRSGRTMSISTDEPGLAVYSADGYPVAPRGGLCLQATAWPDAPNHPGFPSARLDPGTTYHHRTAYAFNRLPSIVGDR